MSLVPGPDHEPTIPFDPIENLLAEALERFEDEGDTAVDALCDANPDLATELRREFEQLKRCGLIGSMPGEEKWPETLGDFKLLEKIGGGGMGVVFLAEQRPLGRRVALKLMRPEYRLHSSARARFEREASAVAALQHPGIVPVHTVGETDGLLWFAMEHVPGCSLEQLIRALADRAPAEVRGGDLLEVICGRAGSELDTTSGVSTRAFDGSLAEIGLRLARQIAEALEHAHARGVLHRDVKPSNIMVTATGRAMLVDFGLAQVDGVSRITLPGRAPGSLPYMAPEQLNGGEIDERTDIYALGVSLYELLTLRMPYQARDEGALREQILAGTPELPRRLHQGLDWEAETVCLVAMDPEPDRRYRTAADLARDLGRAIEGSGIEARRPGVVRRLSRWVRRRPSAAAAAILAFLLLVPTPTVLWWLARDRVEVEGRRATEAREYAAALATESARVTEQRDLAIRREATTGKIKEYLQRILTATTPEVTLGRPLQTTDILQNAMKRIRGDLEGEPQIRSELMTIIATIAQDHGLRAESTALLEDSLALQRSLPEHDPKLLANTLRHLSYAYQGLDRLDEAEAAAKEAIVFDASAADRKAFWVEDLIDLANISVKRRQSVGVEDQLTMAGRMLDALEAGQDLTKTRARWHQVRATFAVEKKDFDEAIEHATAGLEQLRATRHPHDPSIMAALNNRALALKMKGRLEEAAENYTEALNLASLLHAGYEEPTRLAAAGLSQAYQDQDEESEESLRRALARLEATGQGASIQSALIRGNLALLLKKQGRVDEAEALYDTTLGILQAATPPANADLAVAKANLSQLYLVVGRLEEASGLIDESIEVLRPQLEPNSQTLLTLLGVQANCRTQLKRWKDVLEIYDELIPRQESSPTTHPAATAFSYFNQGKALVQLNRTKDAIPSFERSIAIYEESGETARVPYALAQHELAGALATEGRSKDALDRFAIARAKLDLIASPPLALQVQFRASQAAQFLALDRHAEALQPLREALALTEDGPAIDAAWRARIYQLMADVHRGQGNRPEALAALTACRVLLAERFSPGDERVAAVDKQIRELRP
ncbi:MAG: tetratricopeptide repeat protein [Planctomycetes bacterium]|nr:tetratricopeptide repeat protein [Planctomycetota bacterium]